MDRQERMDEDTVIIRAFFLTVEDRGSGPEYALLCPRCYSKTYWRVTDQLPKRCVECGKVLTIRIPLPKKEEDECQSTKSGAESVDSPENSSSAPMTGGKNSTDVSAEAKT